MRGLRNLMSTPALAASLAFTSLAASPAHAGYSITDSAGAGVCCVATADYTARTITAGAFLQTNNTSYIHFSPNYDPIYGATAATSTSNVTNLTAGGVSAFFPGMQGKYPFLEPAAANAIASSDLGLGQLHAYAASEQASLAIVVTPPGAPPPQTFLTDYYSIASADAQFSTDFTVTNTTGADVFIPISWQVHGGFSGDVLPLQLESFLQIRADFNDYTSSTQGVLDYTVDPSTGQVVTSAPGSSDSFVNSFTVVDLGGDSRLMTALFDVQPGQGLGTLGARLNLACWDGSICDYGHTSSLSIGALPDGVTFSFDAPGFLSGDRAAGVPEPGTWTLLLLALGCAGATLRRRRAAAVAGRPRVAA